MADRVASWAAAALDQVGVTANRYVEIVVERQQDTVHEQMLAFQIDRFGHDRGRAVVETRLRVAMKGRSRPSAETLVLVMRDGGHNHLLGVLPVEIGEVVLAPAYGLLEAQNRRIEAENRRLLRAMVRMFANSSDVINACANTLRSTAGLDIEVPQAKPPDHLQRILDLLAESGLLEAFASAVGARPSPNVPPEGWAEPEPIPSPSAGFDAWALAGIAMPTDE